MAQVSYPGVYIEEVPSGVRTITSVATSVTAFVDFFREGPMNQAVEIFGMGDFDRVFGGIDERSAASYAIAQFFLNGGSRALVVRTHAATLADALASATVGVRGTVALADPTLVTFSALSEGAWGNSLRIEIDPRTADPARFFNLAVTRYASADRAAAPIAQERFLNLSLDAASPRDVVRVLAEGSRLIRATVPNPTVAVPAANGTLGGALALTQADFIALGALRRLRVQPGAGAVFEAALPTWPAGDVTNLFQLASKLEHAIRTATNTVDATVPTPAFLTGATVAVVGGNRLLVTAGRGDPDRQVTDLLAFTNAGADTAAAQLGLTAALATANVQQYPLGSALVDAAGYRRGQAGADGLPPDADALVGAAADANDRGIYALRRADLFNLLCLPRAAEVVAAQLRQVVERAIAFCVARRAFMLVDIPAWVDDVAEIRDWLEENANFRSTNSAVFFPRLRIADPRRQYRLESFAASGTMAGIFARTDSERGVWKAPAGIDAVLRGVDDLDYKLTDAENGVLNPLAINCVRAFPLYGTVSWGARTLHGDDQRGSEWKYIPVRRLALMLEETLFRSTKWVVFEPNDELLWAKIRLNVGAYMMSLFRQGAFQNITGNPRDSWFTKCDSETTTQDDRNKGIVNIEVGFAPLKPAEFVVIKIQQMPGDL
jgi:phage tail sheath protein FI